MWLFTSRMVADGNHGFTPAVDEPGDRFVPFIAADFTRIRIVAMMDTIGWIILLAFLVAAAA